MRKNVSLVTDEPRVSGSPGASPRRRVIRLSIFAVVVFSTALSVWQPPVAAQRPPHSQGLVTATFEPTDEDIINPERGFSRFAEVTVSQNALNSGRDNKAAACSA